MRSAPTSILNPFQNVGLTVSTNSASVIFCLSTHSGSLPTRFRWDCQVQQEVCTTFHFALQRSGYLFLGSSENADGPVGAFRALDREARIYQRVSIPSAMRVAPDSIMFATLHLGLALPMPPLVNRNPKCTSRISEGAIYVRGA